MTDNLPGLLSRHTESQSICDIVEPAFEQPQQRVARDTGLPLSPLEHAAELPLLKTVNSPQLLFFTQLKAVIGGPLPPLSVLAGRIAPPLDGALFCHAARTFEKQFLTFSPTEPTDGTAILCHFSTSSCRRHALAHVQNRYSIRRSVPHDLYTPSFRRAAAIMRNRRHITDQVNPQSGSLE